jgi:hypothetical protein
LPEPDATANSGHSGHTGSAKNRNPGHFGHSDQLLSPADPSADSRKSGHSGHNSGKNGKAGKNGKPRERFEESSRYFRGRIVAALRDLEAGATLPLDVLGPRVRDGYTGDDAEWLRTLALGLARDGLARVESGPRGEERVGLP